MKNIVGRKRENYFVIELRNNFWPKSGNCFSRGKYDTGRDEILEEKSVGI